MRWTIRNQGSGQQNTVAVTWPPRQSAVLAATRAVAPERASHHGCATRAANPAVHRTGLAQRSEPARTSGLPADSSVPGPLYSSPGLLRFTPAYHICSEICRLTCIRALRGAGERRRGLGLPVA